MESNLSQHPGLPEPFSHCFADDFVFAHLLPTVCLQRLCHVSLWEQGSA